MPPARPRAERRRTTPAPAAAPVTAAALWEKYHALAYALAVAAVLLVPPAWTQVALVRVEANGPLLLKLAAAYLAVRAALARAPKDAAPAELPPGPPADAPPPVGADHPDAAELRGFLAGVQGGPIPPHLRPAFTAACAAPAAGAADVRGTP